MGSTERPSRRRNSNPRSFKVNSPLLKITILVVDDDSTSLAIISAMLRRFRYEVKSVQNPMAALSVLRANPGNIDLVVTDLHMPGMNGIELQRQIKREFKLPVIIVSSDDSENVMLESLAGGAVFFIVKPVLPDGLKNVWQYVVAAKKGKSMVFEGIEGDSSEAAAARKLSIRNMRRLPSSANDERGGGERGTKRKTQGKENDGRDGDSNPKPHKARKTKVVWTSTLHNKFLDALRHIGLEKAVPKTILEHMNVRGLTRENVASHLQKYRIFLKRVAERDCFSSKNMFDRFLKSSFAAGHPLLTKTAQDYAQMQELQRLRGLTSYPGYGGSYSPHNVGYGQSHLLSHRANKPLFSGNLMNPPNLGILMGYGNRSNLSLNGGFSSGLMSGANSLQPYPQQIQARPGFYDACSSSRFRFGSPGLHSTSSTPVNRILNASGYGGNNNRYTGISSNTDGLSGGYGSMNVATMRNPAFNYLAPGLLGTNQVPPAFTASNQQENTLMPSALNNPGVTDYNPDQLLNNGFDLELGDEDYLNELSDLILGSNKRQLYNHQQAGAVGVDDPEFSLGSLPSLHELWNSDIDDSPEDNAPFEDLINPNTAAAGEANPSDESDPTKFTENTNQAKYLRRKCPPECIFSPHFPPNVPQRFVSVHRIYGASNVAKLLQQLPPHLRAEAAESLCLEAQYRIENPVYGCVGLISLLHQQIHDAEKQLAKTRAEIAVLKSQAQHPQAAPQENLLDIAANLGFSTHQASYGFMVSSFPLLFLSEIVAAEGNMRPVFCGNFEYDARQSDLERLFRKFGRVERVDMKSGACQSLSWGSILGGLFLAEEECQLIEDSFGFAFIYMEDERDAEDAIRALDRTEFGQKGRRLRVEWTKHERGIRRPEGGGGSRRSAANSRPSKTLFVINFDPYHTRTRDLERHFELYGKIVNVRIRRNFAFVQYDSQDDATRALEATNMSKLMDRVISVEYAARDDDDRRNGHAETRGRSPERGRDRRRSPSPYRRERGSPDYGRGSSRSPYRKERGSPDYGRGRSPSHYKRDRGSPEYGQITSRSPPRRERAGSDHARGSSRSPYRKERPSPENIQGPSRSPYRREKRSAENDGSPSHSPDRRERPTSDNGRGADDSPYGRERNSPENGRGADHSPYGRERNSPENGRGPSPSSMPERRASPYGGGAESPLNERYRSQSPAAEE
ncbi:hypothetical protein V6N13_042060 [Hibiscus sabdariffa]